MERGISRDFLKAHILYKLARHRRWGAKHTELINVRTALPQEYQSEAESLARELADAGFLTWLKKTGQIHVSLNTRRKKEIDAIIDKYSQKEITYGH